MRDRYGGSGRGHGEERYGPVYTPVPILRDCVGDMRAEPEKCVCRKQYGFFKSTCAEGQQCFRGDGTCLTFQTVTCATGRDDFSSNYMPWANLLSAYYVGKPYAAYENDDAGRDDAEPGKLTTYSGPDGSAGGDGWELLLNSTRLYDTRSGFSFSFTDKGPDYDLVFTMQEQYGPMPNRDEATCSMMDILDHVVCTTPSGPWTASVSADTQNGAVDIQSSGDEDIADLFMALGANRKRGRWTQDAKVECPSSGMDRAASYSPYRPNNAVTCNVVDEMGLGEIGCGAMRNAGVDCCYDNNANTCGFNRRCRNDGGLFVLLNDDWETQTFGNPEKNHLHDLAEPLIAGRARVPDGVTFVAMTHSHGDDAMDAPEMTDGPGSDGANDDPDCSPGECL